MSTYYVRPSMYMMLRGLIVLTIQCSPLQMLCLESIGMVSATSECCNYRTIFQKSYSSYNSFVKTHGKTIIVRQLTHQQLSESQHADKE